MQNKLKFENDYSDSFLQVTDAYILRQTNLGNSVLQICKRLKSTYGLDYTPKDVASRLKIVKS